MTHSGFGLFTVASRPLGSVSLIVAMPSAWFCLEAPLLPARSEAGRLEGGRVGWWWDRRGKTGEESATGVTPRSDLTAAASVVGQFEGGSPSGWKRSDSRCISKPMRNRLPMLLSAALLAASILLVFRSELHARGPHLLNREAAPATECGFWGDMSAGITCR
jgi:hypothetical protein